MALAGGTVRKTDSGYRVSDKEEQRERAISLLHKGKALCLVSRAPATAQKFEARVEMGTFTSVG